LWGSLAAAAATTAASARARGAARRIAMLAGTATAAWAAWRPRDGDPRALWWPVTACAVIAAATMLGGRPRLGAVFAVLLQAGLLAYAAWALLVTSGSPALPFLDQASEALVLGGVAGAGGSLLAKGASRLRLVLAAAAALGACAAGVAAPGGSHLVLRHLVAAGNSGLPFPVTLALTAAALGGLVIATARPRIFAPLLVAAVCARRPEPHLIAGVLASTVLLVDALVAPREQAERD
jgi:hypothetical protein